MRTIATGAWIALLVGCGFGPAASRDDAMIPDTPPMIDSASPAAVCAALPVTGTVVTVTDVPGLHVAVTTATSGTTIALADGTYALGSSGALLMTTPGVTLRSASGDASKVILDGGNMQSPLVTIVASNVTLTQLTLANAPNVALHVEGGAIADVTGVTIFDVTFTDNGGPAIRLRPYSSLATGPFTDGGTIACSRFAISVGSSADTCTGTVGIDAQAVRGWSVHHDRFDGLTCPSAPHRNVWFRLGSRDTRVTDNEFIHSAMNIMLGDSNGLTNRKFPDQLPVGCSTAPDHWGGVVCNNRIAGLRLPPLPSTDFEEGIALWTACDAWVLHNTVVSPVGAETFHDIEYRFAGSIVHLVNNLTIQAPASRDGGAADYLASDAVDTTISDFVDATAGDLHLIAGASVPVGTSLIPIDLCQTDADGTPRDLAAPTPGAFERP